MFHIPRCLPLMICRDLQWHVLQSTEAVGLVIRVWAEAMRELLRNGPFSRYARDISNVIRDLHLFDTVNINAISKSVRPLAKTNTFGVN